MGGSSSTFALKRQHNNDLQKRKTGLDLVRELFGEFSFKESEEKYVVILPTFIIT